MRTLLPIIVATLTQHPREIVPLELYPDSWTSTCFRIFEWICGKSVGQRPYNSAFFTTKGNVRHITLVQFHCWEAAFAYSEILVRQFFKQFFSLKGWRLDGIRIITPQYATIHGVKMPSTNPYLFAIARDTTTAFGAGSGTTTVTYANYPMAATSSGVLFFGMFGLNAASDDVTGQTFNSVNGSKIAIRATSYRWAYMFYFLAATGTHDIVLTASDNLGGDSQGSGFSYTGCSTSAIDSTNTAAQASGTTFAVSTTVVATGCWLAAFALELGNAITAGANTSIRVGAANFVNADSNATVGTGSQTLNFADAANSAGWGVCIASFAPAAAVRLILPFFTFQAVKRANTY